MRAVLPGWRSGCSARSNAGSALSARVERLDRRPSRAGSRPRAIPPTRTRSSGSVAAGGGRRARSRTARSACAPASTLRAHGLDEAREERRAQDGQLDRDRLRQLPGVGRVVGTQARRVGLGEAEADERVLDAAAQLLLARQRAEHLAPRRQRERHVLEAEARDLLDRRRPRASRRARARSATTTSSPSALEAEPRRGARTGRSGGVSTPISASARSGRKRITGRSGSSPWTSASAVQRAPASSSDQLASRGRPPAPARYGSTPFSQRFEPSVRRRRRSDGAEDPVRLEVRRLEQDGRRRLADLGLLAAHDPGERDRARRRRRSPGRRASSSRSTPSSVRSRSPGRARRTTIRPPCERRRSRRRAAGCRARASRSS